MRARLLIAAATLALPAAGHGQPVRLPPPTVQNPFPQPAPTQPAAIARAVEYRRLRWSTESYWTAAISRLAVSPTSSEQYRTLGQGQHAEYRLTNRFSPSLDIATTLLGDPLSAQTVELGGRFHPLQEPGGVRMYADARGAFARSMNEIGGASTRGSSAPVRHLSYGYGGVAGVGAEVPLVLRFSLLTGVSMARTRMSVSNTSGSGAETRLTPFWSNSYRVHLGLQYNPVRTLRLEQNPMK